MPNDDHDQKKNPKRGAEPEVHEFVVLSHAGDSWQVRLSIPSRELVDQEALLFHLRKVKAEIARMYKINETDLTFGEITRRETLEDSVEVVVTIQTQARTFGEPRIVLRPAVQGSTSYPNMIALLDLAYLDESKEPITLPKVLEAIQKAGIDSSLLDGNLVAQVVNLILIKHTSVTNIVIARGKFPESGRNAEIEFLFQPSTARENATDYLAARQVSEFNVLCRKTPASVGGADGVDVTGKCLPASSGNNIELVAGPGTQLSPDGMKAIARTNGVATVARTMKIIQTPSGPVEAPASVKIKVNSLTQVKGNRVVKISSSDTVQITGSLHPGSQIITEGEVVVSGNVHKDSNIEAADTVSVTGRVIEASINSKSDILTWSDVQGSALQARGQIISQGKIHKSRLIAESIQAEQISGSRLIARNSVSLLTADADAESLLSTVCVGVNEFLKDRIDENNRYLDDAKATLERMEEVFGHTLVAQANPSTVQILFMRFLSQLPQSNIEKKKNANTYRSLIESIPPVQLLIKTKRHEINELLKMLDSNVADGGVLSIRNPLNAPIKVSICGQQTMLRTGKGPLSVRRNDVGVLVVDEV